MREGERERERRLIGAVAAASRTPARPYGVSFFLSRFRRSPHVCVRAPSHPTYIHAYIGIGRHRRINIMHGRGGGGDPRALAPRAHTRGTRGTSDAVSQFDVIFRSSWVIFWINYVVDPYLFTFLKALYWLLGAGNGTWNICLVYFECNSL